MHEKQDSILRPLNQMVPEAEFLMQVLHRSDVIFGYPEHPEIGLLMPAQASGIRAGP